MKRVSDFSCLAIGYFTAPDFMLSIHIPVSQAVIDEGVKALYGVLFAALTRWLFKKIDNRQTTRRKRRDAIKEIKPEPMPDSLTLQLPIDEKESKQVHSH